MPRHALRLTAAVGALALLASGCGGGKSGGSSGTSTPGSPAAAKLAAAQARWAKAGLRDYSYTLTLQCFCPGLRPAAVTVRGGRPVHTGRRTSSYSTVPLLFSTIRDSLARHPARLEVTYDPKLGYPRGFFVDPRQNVNDDELGISVTRFHAGR